MMEIHEQLRSSDSMKSQELDVRKEAQKMIEKHLRHIQTLREHVNRSQFLEKAREATAKFSLQLKAFFEQHGALNLYQGFVGFVSGKVQEMLQKKSETSSQT